MGGNENLPAQRCSRNPICMESNSSSVDRSHNVFVVFYSSGLSMSRLDLVREGLNQRIPENPCIRLGIISKISI